MRLVVAVAMLLPLVACHGHGAGSAAAPTTSVVPAPGALRYVFDHEQIVMTPALAGEQPHWTRAEAVAAVKQAPLFRGTSPQVWFGDYQGKVAWLAIADGLTLAPSLGPPTKGYQLAVFADDTTPAQAIGGVAETGGAAPNPDAAPARHGYDGLLHVTFVTPSGGAIGGSLAKWMMQPATYAHPQLSVADAQRHAMPGGRVFFGLFTGLDDSGTLRTRSPGWMVLATHVRLVALGPTKDTRPRYGFGVSAFSDDLAHPWTSGELTSGGTPPLAN